MLYWICPECGGECSPAIRECPACAGNPVSPASAGPVHRKAAVTEEVLALVQNLQATAHSPVANGLAGNNGYSAPTATLELPESSGEPSLCVPPQETIESLVRPLIESTNLAARIEPLAEPGVPPDLSAAMILQAELVLDSITQQDLARQSAIGGIVASFQKQPASALLAPAREVVKAPAPVCLQWMRASKPRILPVPPADLKHRDFFSGVQTPPLAGPCVPGELRSLTKLTGPTQGYARRKAGLPAWTISFLVALTLFLGVGSMLQYWAANRDGKGAVPASPSDQSPPTATAGEQPASKLVEVTGLRIATGSNQRPQLEFIVVNHSAVMLSDVGLRIAVRSASSQPGVAPLFRVSTTIASLGAYQSREFRAELDPEVHATDVPDWQSLKADVRITQ